MTGRIAWIVIAMLATYVVFVGGSWSGLYLPELRLISVFLAAGGLAAWLVAAVRSPGWRPRSVLLPAILACLASLAVSTMTSRYPAISLEYLGYALVLTALYLLLRTLMAHAFFRERFTAFAVILFVVLVVLYLGLSLSHLITWWSIAGRVTSPPLRLEFEALGFGNPSTLLTMVALLAIPVVGALDWSSRRGAAVAVIVVGLVGAVAYLTGSRAGWLALAIAGVVGVGFVLAMPGSRRVAVARVQQWIATPRTRLLLIALVAVVVIAAIVVAPTILRRAGAGGETNRFVFVLVALRLFAEAPLLGTGPGTWVIQRAAYTRAGEPDEYIPHAHNVYAQTLGELGVVGAIAGLILLASLILLLRSAVRDPDPRRRRFGWATVIGLVYFAAHQLLDFYPNFPAVLFAAAIPVAYLDATAPQPMLRKARWRPVTLPAPALAAGAIAVAVALVGLGLQELPAVKSQAAVDAANEFRWADADRPAREAAAEDPRIASYLFTAGLTAAHVGDHAAAVSYFRRVVATGDDNNEAWLNLAAEEYLIGDKADVAAHLERATRLGVQRQSTAIAAGELALRAGDRALAVRLLGLAVSRWPSFINDPWWTTGAGASVRDDVLADARARLPGPAAWEVELMAGNADVARSLAVGSGVPEAADFVDAWTGDNAAAQRLYGYCGANLSDGPALDMCARIASRNGDIGRATGYRYLANAQNMVTTGDLRIEAPGDRSPREIAGTLATYWGTFTYRRFTPWDTLVPSLIHLGFR